MHIGFDLTCLMEHRSGVDVAARELLFSLADADRENQYTVFLNREDAAEFQSRLPASFRLRAWSRRNRPVRALVQQAGIPWACRRDSIDVLHSPAFLTPMLRGRYRQLVTVHDVTFFSLTKTHRSFHQTTVFREAVRRSAHRADLIHVPSDAVREQVAEWWPKIPKERTRVISWGIGAEFHTAARDEIERHRLRLRLPQRFILFTGTIEPRKNVELLAGAYRRVVRDGATDTHLVLAGKLGWDYGQTLEILRSSELRGRVHLLGFVEPEDLPWVYRAASMFVYPSLYEGFGFPPLEALASGVPVIASLGSALEENLAGVADLIPPSDREALVEAIERLLREPAEMRAMRIHAGQEHARRFRWSETARRMISCYRELSGST